MNGVCGPILVIDDETPIRNLFRDALDGWGYAVDTASTGEAGLELLRQKSYDVVLTDYLMPGISGVEVARVVQRENRATTVILVTGSANDDEFRAARRCNVTVLSKPVALEELRAAIGRAVRLGVRELVEFPA